MMKVRENFCAKSERKELQPRNGIRLSVKFLTRHDETLRLQVVFSTIAPPSI
jgi:hypothetical protein